MKSWNGPGWALVALIGLGCGKTSPTAERVERTPISGQGTGLGTSTRDLLGEFIGTWDATTGKLSFQPAERNAAGVLVPSEIGALAHALVQFDQQAVGYNATTTPTTVGGFSCAVPSGSAASVCGVVKIAAYQTATPHTYDDVIVDVSVLNGGWAVSGDDFAGLPSGLKSDVCLAHGFASSCTSTNGDWDYGRLAPAISSTGNGPDGVAKLWQFNTATAGTTFTFAVQVLGRRSYSLTNDASFTSTDPFYDAVGNAGRGWQPGFNITAATSGATTLIGAGKSGTVAAFTSPFSVSIFEQSGTSMWVSSSGVMGLGTAPTADTTLTTGATALPSSAFTYAIYPFWSQLQTGSSWLSTSGSVAWSVVGTTPNRKLVVTWANMSFVNTNTGLNGTTACNNLVDEYFSVEIDEMQASQVANTIHIQAILPGFATAYTPTTGCGAFANGFGSAGYASSGTKNAASIGIQGAADAALVYGNLGAVNTSLVGATLTQPTFGGVNVLLSTNLLPATANLNLTFTP